MKKRTRKLLALGIVSVSLMLNSVPYYAEEMSEVEAQSELHSEAPAEPTPAPEPATEPAPQTEPAPAPAPEPTPAPEPAPEPTPEPTPTTEPVTEPVTEPSTPATEPATEQHTEAPTEASTEKTTEASTEKATEQSTEATTEAGTEASTEGNHSTPIPENPDEKKLNQDVVDAGEIGTDLNLSEDEVPFYSTVTASDELVVIAGFHVDPSLYPPANVGKNTTYVYNYLRKELKLNHAAACGVLGNIQLESNFNPLALGDGGTSYGLCQWHLGRFSSLMSFCNGNDLDYNTVDGQLAYLKEELTNGYSGVYEYLLSVPDTPQGAYDAAYYMCIHFEAPDQAEARGAQRGNLASKDYFTKSFEDIEKMAKAAGSLARELATSLSGSAVVLSEVNVRSASNTESEVLGKLQEGDEIFVKSISGTVDWYEVDYDVDGETKTGYVNGDYLDVSLDSITVTLESNLKRPETVLSSEDSEASTFEVNAVEKENKVVPKEDNTPVFSMEVSRSSDGTVAVSKG